MARLVISCTLYTVHMLAKKLQNVLQHTNVLLQYVDNYIASWIGSYLLIRNHYDKYSWLIVIIQWL